MICLSVSSDSWFVRGLQRCAEVCKGVKRCEKVLKVMLGYAGECLVVLECDRCRVLLRCARVCKGARGSVLQNLLFACI